MISLNFENMMAKETKTFGRWPTVVVGLLLMLSGCCRALPASSNCDAARTLMTSLKLVSEVPSSPVSGGGGLVCEGDRTCCPAQTETALRHSAATDFHHAVRQSSHQLRLTLAHSATAIQGQLVRHVKASMAKTQTMFDELYKRVALLARSPVEQLFEQLERFVLSSDEDSSGNGGDPADVSDAVAAFFDDLFPRLYGQSPRSVHQSPSLPANSVGVRFAQDYVDCLRHAQSELRPFGEIPRRLANSLARSLDAARALLSALDLGVRVLNATDHAELNGQCRDALLRATHCASCRVSATTTTAPSPHRVCRGLCSNVARGCLAAVADVDQPWNEWVDAMERLTTTLINPVKSAAATVDLGPHDILSSVDSRISEAVLYALENGPLLEKKVKRICGENVNSSIINGGADELADGNIEGGSVPPAVNVVADGVVEEKEGLRKRLESLLPTLATARGFYANLPDAVCSQAGTPFQSLQSDQEQTLCWNGQRYAEYTKPISGIGIGAQKYNAEVRVSRSDVDSHLVQLSDRLRHVRQVLISKTVSAPEPDSLVMADFGSGSGDGAGGANVGVGRSGGAWDDGSDAEPDEDGLPGGDHTFADLDGSGSGHGPNEPNNWNSGGSGVKKTGSDGFDLGPGRDSVNTKPRVTVTDSSSGSSAARRVSVSAGWLVSLAFTLLFCSTTASIWRQ